jgi:hypothetical protein
MADPVKMFVAGVIKEYQSGKKSLSEAVDEIVEFMEEVNKC